MDAKTHHFSLGSITPQTEKPGGTRTDVTSRELQTLEGMSLSLLTLYSLGVREPHWHPNANELSYCLEGKGLMTVFSPGNIHDTFTVEKGEIVFIPKNYLHHIENIGDSPLSFLVCFNHESPEDVGLSALTSVMPDSILGATFGVNPQFFEKMKKDAKGVFISQREEAAIPPLPYITNHFKLNLEALQPLMNHTGGWVKTSNAFLLPSLEGLAVYSLYLNENGAREPHWHPNAHELNYLIQGQARITLLSPGGNVDTFDMKAGDLSFLPMGYPHYIENLGPGPVRFAIFFNNSAPSDLGISGSFGAYSNEVLASLFGVPATSFDKLPKFQEDLLVISR